MPDDLDDIMDQYPQIEAAERKAQAQARAKETEARRTVVIAGQPMSVPVRPLVGVVAGSVINFGRRR